MRLFAATQQRVLALLYGQPERELTVSEIIALASTGSGSVQRELRKLSTAGLVEARRARGRSLYRANKLSPVFEELRCLVKTMAIRHQVEGALAPIADRIVLAVIFGSEAKATATASSDVDLLLVVDDLTLEEVHAALEPPERPPEPPEIDEVGFREVEIDSLLDFGEGLGQEPIRPHQRF